MVFKNCLIESYLLFKFSTGVCFFKPLKQAIVVASAPGFYYSASFTRHVVGLTFTNLSPSVTDISLLSLF